MNTTASVRRRTLAAAITAVALAAVVPVTTAAVLPEAPGHSRVAGNPTAGYGESARLGYQKAVAVQVLRGVFEKNIPDGLVGVKAALGAYFAQFPQLRIIPKRIIAEGGLVAVHSHIVNVPGERGQAVVDLFRVRRGRIVGGPRESASARRGLRHRPHD